MSSETLADQAMAGGPAVPPETQLEWERRHGRQAGVAAIASVLCFLGSAIWQASAIHATSSDADDVLRAVDAHAGPVIGAGVMQAIGVLLMAPVLWFLYRATLYRRHQIPKIALVLALAAPLLVGAITVARQVALVHAAQDFVAAKAPDVSGLSKITNPNAYADAVEKLDPKQRAQDQLGKGALPAISGVGLAANLALAFAFVMVALNAMRAGLLSRFMGVVGIIIGVLYVIPLGGPQILQIFWLTGLALMFYDRWPGGRGPAWETAEAIPWPSAADRTHGDRPPPLFGGRMTRPAPEPAPPPETAALPEPANGSDPAAETQGQRRKKRKRKR